MFFTDYEPIAGHFKDYTIQDKFITFRSIHQDVNGLVLFLFNEHNKYTY